MNAAIDTLLNPILGKIKPINTTFRELVPYESVVNPTAINDFANEQVNPDAYQQASRGYNNMMGSQYRSGMNRFGAGKQQAQDTINSYERNRQDQLQQFRNAMEGNLADSYRQYELGFNEDPNAGWVADFMNQYKNGPQFSNQLNQTMQKNPLANNYSALKGQFRGF